MRPPARSASILRFFRRVTAVGAVFAGTLAALAAPAGAAWLSPVDLSPETGINAAQVDVAMDHRGDAVAVWQASNSTETSVQVSVRSASTGTWGTPTVLTTEGNGIKDASVAVDERGNAAVIWQVESGLTSSVKAAVKRAGSAVWHVESVSSEEGSRPSIAIDSHGDAVAVWLAQPTDAVTSSVRPVAGEWHAPVQLSSAGLSAEQPTVTTNPRGDAVAAWHGFEGENFSIAQAAVRPASSGTWSAAATLSTPEEAGANALATRAAIDAHGNATVTWTREDVLKSATRLASSATWGAPVDVSSGGEQVNTHGLAVDSHGEAVAVWAGLSGSANVVESASRASAGTSWHEPVRLLTAPAGKSPSEPAVAINQAGRAVAVWTVSLGKFLTFRTFIQSSVRPEATVAWGEPVTLTPETENARFPRVAVSPPGDAVAAWELVHGKSENIVQSAFYEP
jgi:hypothetical protein